MKSKFTTHHQKRIRNIGIVAALLLLITLGIFILFKIKDSNAGHKSINKPDVTNTSIDTAKPDDNQSELPTSNEGKNVTDDSDNNPAPVDNTVGMYISNYNFDLDSNTVAINTLIQILDNIGKCNLILSKDGTVLTANSTSFASSRVSNCHFEVTSKDLSPGKWQAKISYKGSAASANVNQEINL